MLDEEILELRRKLDESITKEKNYDRTYRLSIELDKLISKYYNKKLMRKTKTDIWKNVSSKWGCDKYILACFFTKICPKCYNNIIFYAKLYKIINIMLKWKR